MKYKLKNICIILGLAAIMTGNESCKKVDFGNINQNPNQTTEPITSALLTNVLAGLYTSGYDVGGMRTVAGYYAQYFSQTQYTESSRYSPTTTNIDGYYVTSLNDLQMIINYNTDEKNKGNAAANGSNNNQIATARILKAYLFWALTDMWGDIPYSEALKGNGSPKYDKQQDIYKDLIKELKEAVDQFDAGAAAKGDILFSGNISKWKKFANSVRILMALQMSKVDATLGKAEFASALSHSAGVMESLSDNAVINFPGGGYQNPSWVYYNIAPRDDEAVAKTITDWLSARNDPRINVYGSSAVGFPYGLTRDNAVAFGNANTNFARPLHPSLRTETSPVTILGAAHIWLARAEAAFRGWTAESYATTYARGIEESMKQWGVYSAGALASYLTQTEIDLSTGSALDKIITQEWASSYPLGVRGWNIWRRTGLPTLTPAPGMTQIPRRFVHGANEPNLNPQNWAAGVAPYTVAGQADSQFGKLWWDN